MFARRDIEKGILMLRHSALYAIPLKAAMRAVLPLQIFAPAGTAEPYNEATAPGMPVQGHS
jgi:hypothetical protein